MACNCNHKPCDDDFNKKPCGCECGCHRPKPEEPCGCDAAAYSAPAECYTLSNCGCGFTPDCARVLSACGNADEPDEAVDCTGIPIKHGCGRKVKYRTCCDQNGKCYRFPCQCRNPFWPEFCHPRWLCCRALYCNGSCNCANAANAQNPAGQTNETSGCGCNS